MHLQTALLILLGSDVQLHWHFSWQMPPALHMQHSLMGCAGDTYVEALAACLAGRAGLKRSGALAAYMAGQPAS